MANYYFVGDGSEVLACEAYEANAISEANRLNKLSGDNCHNVYCLTGDELSQQADGLYDMPHERAMCLQSYDL